MSDLSNLLGDVYGDHSSPDGPSVRREPAAADRVPEWSEESRLDRAFADWEPEARFPLDDKVATPAEDPLAAALSAALGEVSAPAAPPMPAPAAAAPVVAVPEFRAPEPLAPMPEPIMSSPAPMPSMPSMPVSAPAKPAWTALAAPVAPIVPLAAAPAPVIAGMWVPGDDDIFPGGRSAKKGKR